MSNSRDENENCNNALLIKLDKRERSKFDNSHIPNQTKQNNYFAMKDHYNSMEIIEEEKSNFISKLNLAIPPEKIISQNNSLYTDSPLIKDLNYGIKY